MLDNNWSGSACDKLMLQEPKLEEWIDTMAAGPQPFIVLGDFNRRLNVPGDIIWTNLDDGQPANADLLAATENMPISCRNNEFTEFIDHIVFDRRWTAFVDRSSFRQVTFRQADKSVPDKSPTTVRRRRNVGAVTLRRPPRLPFSSRFA